MSNEITDEEAISLYYEKQYAMQQGDIAKLLELKKRYPAMFDKKKEARIRAIIDFAKQFMTSQAYKKMHQLKMKSKLTLIKNDVLDE